MGKIGSDPGWKKMREEEGKFYLERARLSTGILLA
jgi:hypothetical protein